MNLSDCKRDVLAALKAEPSGYRFKALARVVKWGDTDVRRVVTDLEEQGLIIAEPYPRPQSTTKRYRLRPNLE